MRSKKQRKIFRFVPKRPQARRLRPQWLQSVALLSRVYNHLAMK